MEREAHRVADAARVDLERAPVGVHARDGAVPLLRLTDVARRAHRHIGLAVAPERDVAPLMVAHREEAVLGDHWLGRIREPILDAVVADDALNLADIEGAVAEGDAVRLVQPACDREYLIRPAV